MKKIKRLEYECHYPGFRYSGMSGVLGDPRAVLIRLTKRAKKMHGCCGTVHHAWYDQTIHRVQDLGGQIKDYNFKQLDKETMVHPEKL